MSTAVVVFWISGGFIAYTYAVYPLLVAVLSCLRPRVASPLPNDAELPRTTIVMAAYNEAARLPEKILNLRALDYPAEKLDILVVSDGSTDGSDQVISGLDGVHVLAYAQRQGKAHALNLAMQHVDTEFVVFCDVRQDLAPSSVRRLMANFSLPGVGAVSGELVHRASGTQTGQSIGLYWRYEKWIRKSESRLRSTVGATGALYAIRTGDYHPLASDTILDDFEIPMHIVRHGQRTLLDSEAHVYDSLQIHSTAEKKRKIRTLTGNFQTFSRNPWLFTPWQNPVFLQFLSHKVFRLFVPYALALALISSALASSWFYHALLVLQLGFYLLAAAGQWLPATRNNRLISFAHVFFDMNAAAIIALLHFVSGQVNAKWEKT